MNDIEEEQSIKEIEYEALAKEKQEYELKIISLESQEEQLLIDKATLEKTGSKEALTKTNNDIVDVEEQIDNYTTKLSLVDIDHAVVKYNQSLGARLPVSAAAAKENIQKVSNVIANLQDSRLKEKICKNIIPLSLDALEMLSNLLADREVTIVSGGGRGSGGYGSIEQGNRPKFRFEKPMLPKLPIDDIGEAIVSLLRQLASIAHRGLQ
jgi:hypothetical protein